VTAKKFERQGNASEGTLRQAIGKRFRSERKRLGLTQEQLGDRLEVISLSIANYEHGVSCPAADVLYRLHLAGGDVGFIVTGSRSPSLGISTGEVATPIRAQPNAKKRPGRGMGS